MLHITNIGLRGITLLSKFILIFYLAIYLTPTEIGFYGLIVATIAYTTYFLGLEFHTYNVRELIGTDNSHQGNLIKRQLCLHLRLYLIFLPFLFFVFILDFLPWHLAPIFFIILILEHLNQEIFRLLIALSKQIEASICLFLRQGLWTIIIVFIMNEWTSLKNLETVLIAWSIGSLSAFLIGIFSIKKINLGGWQNKIDWQWVIKGVKKATPLLIASLSLNAISTGERYWFAFLNDVEILGIYVFYISLSASLLSFLDAGVFSFLYPKLIESAKIEDHDSFKKNMKKMLMGCFFLTMIFISLSLIFSIFFIDILNKIYKEYIFLFYLSLFSISIHGLSYVYHYALYSYQKDNYILKAHTLSLILFIILSLTISQWSNLYSVPLAVAFSYSFIFIYKFFLYKKITEDIENA